jgi:uncharacterized heparinase superfamily protein
LNLAKKAFLYWNTIRYLKPIQIYRRYWFRYYRPSLNPVLPQVERATQKGIWHYAVPRPQSLVQENIFNFLNMSHRLADASDWNNPRLPKLWLYNLHYFDDLNAEGSINRVDWHHNLIARWISDNPAMLGNGWEPYPISLRIVNWIKWSLGEVILDDRTIQSLYLQARYLSKRVEWHLLGNHLLANAKALIFAGIFFAGEESKDWLNLGQKIFYKQIPEQILPDGMHFERSPMYHAIILEDVLDLLNLAQAYPGAMAVSLEKSLRLCSKRMFKAYKILIHPDGQIGLFNDAAFQISASYAQLYVYAQSLGITNVIDCPRISYEKSGDFELNQLMDAGYIRVVSKNACALIDVGAVGPDYLPGHAHADTLSFELSIYDQRVIVNGGTSTYSDIDLRGYERSTAAHSTVEINGQNSSEVWSHFRVARRAYPRDLTVKSIDGGFQVDCSHDGYARLSCSATHTRKWRVTKNTLFIDDLVKVRKSAKKPCAIARYIFHPSIQVHQLDQNQWELLLPNRKIVQIQVLSGEASIESSKYAAEFGNSQATQCLAIKLVGPVSLQAQVEIRWI